MKFARWGYFSLRLLSTSTCGPHTALVQNAGLANTMIVGFPLSMASGIDILYRSGFRIDPVVRSAMSSTSSKVRLRMRGGVCPMSTDIVFSWMFMMTSTYSMFPLGLGTLASTPHLPGVLKFISAACSPLDPYGNG